MDSAKASGYKKYIGQGVPLDVERLAVFSDETALRLQLCT